MTKKQDSYVYNSFFLTIQITFNSVTESFQLWKFQSIPSDNFHIFVTDSFWD